MKICYFTPYYPPQSEAAATRAYWFIKTLREAGHEVEIITNSQMMMKLGTNKDKALTRLVKEHLAGIELFIRLLFTSTEMFVLSSPPFFTVIWGVLACWVRKKKYILDVRDLYPEVFFEMGLMAEESALGVAAKRTAKNIYLKSQGIMTVTEGLVKEIQNYGIDENKIILAMNGYDPDFFYPGKQSDHFKKFTLVFHGTLGKAQNITTLLNLAEALQEDESIEIVVAGDGPKLEDILQANKSNIRYVGNLPYEEIPKLLRRCHVGLSFRTDDKIGKEAFPVKVFEYIGCQLPVILSPKGEAGELVESKKLGQQFQNSEIILMKAYIRELKKSNFSVNTEASFSRKESSKKILSFLQV